MEHLFLTLFQELIYGLLENGKQDELMEYSNFTVKKEI